MRAEITPEPKRTKEQMNLYTLNDVVASARLFHSGDISELVEEAQFEAEEKRRRDPPMGRLARDPLEPKVTTGGTLRRPA